MKTLLWTAIFSIFAAAAQAAPPQPALLNSLLDGAALQDKRQPAGSLTRDEIRDAIVKMNFRRWVEELDDGDSDVREQAVREMMDNYGELLKSRIEAVLPRIKNQRVRSSLNYVLKEGPRDPASRVMEQMLSKECQASWPGIADLVYSKDEKILESVFMRAANALRAGDRGLQCGKEDLGVILRDMLSHTLQLQPLWSELKSSSFKRALMEQFSHALWPHRFKRALESLYWKDEDAEIRAAAKKILLTMHNCGNMCDPDCIYEKDR